MPTIKQTGVIPAYPKPEDYITGGETAIKAKPRTKDWGKYLPVKESQQNLKFDSLSCTSFSFNNVVEAQINYMLEAGELPPEASKWLIDNGYIGAEGKCNLSDRYLAVMSKTTNKGNDFRTVAETARLFGAIPESDLPFTGSTFAEYHDPSAITDAMKSKAQEFLLRVNIQWEWAFFDTSTGFNEGYQVKRIIEESPIQVGIPTPATHATVMIAYDETLNETTFFDTYEPFIFKGNADNYNPHFGMRTLVTAKETPELPKVPLAFTFKVNLVQGAKGAEVVYLQRVLIREGFLKVGLDTGNFFALTLQAVKNFQMKYGIPTTGNVGTLTRAKLNEILKVQKKSYK